MSQADAPTTATDAMPGGQATSERRLVDGLRRGDEAAATELVERYAPRAYRVALGITRNAASAEHVVRDALGRVIRNVDTFPGDDAALAVWLCRIVATAAYGKVRRSAHRGIDIVLDALLPAFHEDTPLATVDDWSPRLDDPAMQRRVRATLQAALDELSPDDRAVVVLRDVEGLTLSEAATALSITVAAAKARLHRARLFLRKRLAGVMATV
jgi:RNA polymerase sigma-70 factor (ECF subfamily)